MTFLVAAGCYSPSLPNGKQQCGTNGACPSGYSCGPDDHCYKMGQVPSGGDASAVADGGMTACTATSCKGGAKPICDSKSGNCVECLADGDCPSGKVCSNEACVPGCTDTHGCPDGGGTCTNKMCAVCMKDADCSGNTPRCDTNSGNCVECLPTNDNCPMGKFCGQVNSVYTCQTGCDDVSQCPKPDGGGAQACCNHVCVDTDLDGKNCGGCNTDCGKESCCGGQCSDVTMDLANCGLCGNACAGKGAMWSCMTSSCNITSCNQGFGNCNGSSADGCEATLASDPNNCGMCNMKCSAQNAVAGCANGMCTVGMCNMGFGNCDNNVANGCETNTNGDPANCGKCGMKCSYTNAQAACVAGSCALAMCNNGFSDCDMNQANGCESSTASDPNNCGGCGIKCSGVPPNTTGVNCANSKCSILACTNGFKDCDMQEPNGCESNTASDPNNCGGCGAKCAAGANVATTGCANSACTIASCNAGFGNCDNNVANGCETDTTSNPNNCGVCGKVCPNGQTCTNSVCVMIAITRVLVIHGGADPYLACAVTGLQAYYNTVDAIVGPPTPADLAAHDAVLVFNNGAHPDPTTLGNVMADWFDAHGHVVEALYGTGGLSQMAGRWATGGYPVLSGAWNGNNVSLGVINEPGSPLMTGVAAFTTQRSVTGGVVNGGIVVAQYNSGTPLVVRGTKSGHNRVDLGMFPGGCNGGLWTGNGIELMRNALNY